MASLPEFTKAELYEKPFPWTIIGGQVYAIGSFLHSHPGGLLIRRAIGEEERAGRVSSLRFASVRSVVPLLSQNFKAEVVAVLMLILFFSWCYCSYVLGCWRLNIALSWFWWRHLDAGLHAVMHGDFRTRHDIQAGLFWIYSLLSHRAMEYYYGARELKGNGMSKHWWHHIYPNDPGQLGASDFRSGIGLGPAAYERPMASLPPVAVACALLEAVASLLEPPMNGPYVSRWAHVLGFLCEVLFNPGFQLVQHYMPEHILNREAADDSAEWVIGQLLCTANLEFRNRWAWLMDFLMFHGDSHQIEHHLWPAMSFVQYTKASQVVRATCARLRLPYYTVGYFEGYQKICEQVKEHRKPPPRPKRPRSPGEERGHGARHAFSGAPGHRRQHQVSVMSTPD
eukprot:g5224.t2